jgi:thiol-disulfide isomerase/thioredoxin
MTWCPKCRSEYEDHVKVCKQCDVELVDKLEEDKKHYQNLEFLINVASLNEANILISLLESYGIPSFYKSKGSGEYLQVIAGINYQGIDIYVPANVLAKAREIINHSSDEDIDKENISEAYNLYEDERLRELDKNTSSNRRISLLILLFLLLVIPLLIAMINYIL